jgi:putative intracellular protease/amidase
MKHPSGIEAASSPQASVSALLSLARSTANRSWSCWTSRTRTDADGEAALIQAIERVRARGGIVAVVAHRPSVLAAVDMVAVIGGGKLTAFGLRDEVLRRAVKTPVETAPVATLSLVSDNGS